MAVRLADAVAYLSTNDDQLKQGLADGERKVSGWSSAINGALMGVGMAAFNAIAGAAQQAVSYMGDAVAAASDIGETTSKVGVVFESGSASVLAWADNAAQAFGQSKQQALDAASTFAIFGKSAGLSGDDLVKFSTEFTGLASDLASFNNTSPEQAIEAIGAALRGEAEPMRAYGVLLDDASMRQKALEMGIISTTKEALTPQQKVLAAQALIYEQTALAQGDFARTSGGLANQQRILDAQMTNLKTTVGEALLPVMLAFTTLMNEIVQKVLPPVTSFVRDQVVPAMTAMGEAIGSMVTTARDWFARFSGSVDTGAIRPLNFFKGWLDQNMPRIQQVVETVLSAIGGFWDEHGERIMSVVQTLFGWLTMFWETQFRTILNIVQVMLQILTGDFEGAGNTLRTILNDWRMFFETIIRGIVNGIRSWFSDVDWGAVGRNILEGIANGLRNGGGYIAQVARDAAERAKQSFLNLWGIHSPSRVAADEIGEPFAQGIGVGIRNGLSSVTGDINSGLRGLMAGITTPAPTGAISITVNVSGTDAAGAGLAARDGVLSALRAAGLR